MLAAILWSRSSFCAHEHCGTQYWAATSVVGQGARRNVTVEIEFAHKICNPWKHLGQALQFGLDLGVQPRGIPVACFQLVTDSPLLNNHQHYTLPTTMSTHRHHPPYHQNQEETVL